MTHMHRLPMLLIAGTFALTGGIGAYAAASSGDGGDKPPAKPLAEALHGALTAPKPKGVTARIEFKNDLIDASALKGKSPLLSGAQGRLWMAADGRMRIDLQSDAGDGQIQVANGRATFYDKRTNRLYTLPGPEKGGKLPEGIRLPNGLKLPDGIEAPKELRSEDGRLEAPSVPMIQLGLQFLSDEIELSDAEPANVGGRPAYTVRISPRHDGGLLGAVEVSWDAQRGVPLRGAVYAQGKSDPVLELTATEVDYGPVAERDLELKVPSDARRVEIEPGKESDDNDDESAKRPEANGLDAVQDRVSFDIAAPPELAKLPRKLAHEVRVDGQSGAVVTYGEGLGGIAVLQVPESAGPSFDDVAKELPLPELAIDGATGRELTTALGTIITFERGGVNYTIAGLVPPAAAEQAARELK